MEDMLREITQICQSHSIVKKAVLFGSRARGTHTSTSDFDLAVWLQPDGREKITLLDRFDTINSLHKLDIVLVTEKTDDILLKNIEKEGIVLMERRTKIENYEKAVARLTEAVALCQENPCSFYFDALIQRFEFTTELAWKSCKEQLQEQGFLEVNGPKAVMREAFSAGLVEDDHLWIGILTDRNRTSHIYDEDTAREIAENVMGCYLPVFLTLLEKLKSL